MPYKTISLKLLRPSRVKRNFLDNALERYSLSFEQILRRIGSLNPNLAVLSKTQQQKLLDAEVMSIADNYDAQPFKDALKMDISMLLSSYSGRVKAGMQSNFPVTRTDNEDINKIINSDEKVTKRQINAVFDKLGNYRPLLLCRFGINRDYSILKQNNTDGYYVKVYLFNLKNAIPVNGNENKPLKYITNGEELTHTRRKKRYLILPLQTGDWQKKHLKEIEQGKAMPKSAVLVKKGHEYFLNVRLWYEPISAFSVKTYLGVVRGVTGELCYHVCCRNGEGLETGIISSNKNRGKNRLHHLANSILKLAADNKSQLVLYNLTTRSDSLNQSDWIASVSPSEYTELEQMVAYKSELRGLPVPVSVSPSGVFYKCPCCTSFKYANRMDRNIFLCTNCGFSGRLEEIGAGNLARALITYKRNKLNVHYYQQHGEIHFYCKALGLSYSCTDGSHALNSFYKYIYTYLIESQNKKNKKLTSIYKKLSSSDDISEHIKLIPVKN